MFHCLRKKQIERLTHVPVEQLAQTVLSELQQQLDRPSPLKDSIFKAMKRASTWLSTPSPVNGASCIVNTTSQSLMCRMICQRCSSSLLIVKTLQKIS
jgi:hypothetical protein